jgi:FKBP-type peptidyl-prolyl cis-trans isomerase
MRYLANPRFLCLLVALFVLPQTFCFGQTQNEAAVLQGEGAFLRGAGSYNLNTASATSINIDTIIRWKKEVRDDAARNRALQARNAAGKKLRIEEVHKLQQDRERKLRIDPDATDIITGDALNVLLYDLTDPDFKSADWSSKIVNLPEGMSVKDLVFRFTPLSGSSDTSKALSRGVIALSLLDITGDKWPVVMRQNELKDERLAYEAAYAKLKDQLINDDLKLQALAELDQTLVALKKKAEKEIPKDRGFRDEATKFVDDLKNASRFFDAKTVDYAKEILVDTKDKDARTVAELVGFMLKYRLQFASAERSATGRPLYGQLYEVMQKQAKEFGIEPPSDEAVEPPIPKFATAKSGLKYRVLAKGEGTTPTMGSTVVCHYKGWFDDGTEFDNSYKRNDPIEIRLKEVIAGWQEGLQLIKSGGKIDLEIPPKLAYGVDGKGRIPPNATVHFTIELIKVK